MSAKTRAAQSASAAATFLTIMALLEGLAGVVGGALLALHTNKSGCTASLIDSSISCSGTSHPYIAAGISVAFGAVFTAAFAIAIASHIKLRVAQVLGS